MSNHIEVRFRGENEPNLLAWRPTDRSLYECTASEARERFNDLVERGIKGIPVDGVVPFVVEIRSVKRTFVPHQNADAAICETLLWQYCEEDAVPMGPWGEELEAHRPAASRPTVEMAATN